MSVDLLKEKAGGGGGGDGGEVGAVDVVGVDGWAGVGGFGLDFDVAHLHAVDVAEVEAVGGQGAEHGGLGVGVSFSGTSILAWSGVPPPVVST